jgi:hypothetical protein
MARRLAFFFDKLHANPKAPPLATDYITDDQDLVEAMGKRVMTRTPRT